MAHSDSESENTHCSEADTLAVFNACKDGYLETLKNALQRQSSDNVYHLVHAKTDGATPLIMSARNGHYRIVKYLIEICKADFTQPGCVRFDGEIIEGAPPLWCAAAAGYLNIVSYMVDQGADVNQTTLTNSTPLRAACFDGHYNIVKFLVQKKADIEIANRHGHTCLMIACYKGHKIIVEFLLSLKADVNRKSIKGNTAMHDSAESGSLEIMKLLLSGGAKMVKDSYGMTPLMAAAVAGFRNIIDFLVARPDCSRAEYVDALELLGATYVDKKRDSLEAIRVWRRALKERQRPGKKPLKKVKPERRNPAYFDAVEAETVEELEELVSDPDEVRMQALLIRERVLGPTHPDTTYYIRYRGALYADLGDFGRCITLWMYALELQQSVLDPLAPMTMSSFLSFAELFAFMLQEEGTRLILGEDKEVYAKDILQVMQLGVGEIRRWQAQAARERGKDLSVLARMLTILLHLMCLMNRMPCCRLKLRLEEDTPLSQRYRHLVYGLVKLDVRGTGGATLLHLACASETTNVGRYPVCNFPSESVVDLLLHVGACPNAADDLGNTALHAITKPATGQVAGRLPPSVAVVIGNLLEAGAHADMCNAGHVTPMDNLKRLGPRALKVANHVKYTTLKCLAARVLAHGNYAYKGLVDSDLEKFISMH